MAEEKQLHPDPHTEGPSAEVPSSSPADLGVSATEDPSPHDEHVERLLLHTIDLPELASAVERQQPADAADTLERLEEEEAAELLHEMEELRAARALAEMEPQLAVGVIEDIIEENPGYAADLVEHMDDDQAADLVQLLPEGYRGRLLEVMEFEPAQLLARLIKYDRESAGGMMTTDFLALRDGMTVQQAIEYVRARAVSDHIQDALVTDRHKRLVGIIPLYRLLLERPTKKIGEIMRTSVKAVHPDTDREDVAREFDRYDHAMLPVIDDHDRVLGMVTVDDVIDIIRAEQTEDVQKTVGAGAGEAVYSRVVEKFRGRAPWLVVSLVMMIPAAMIILEFEDLVRDWPVLAVLMPVIAALVGNAGHQALAVTQRGLVLGEVRRERIMPLLLREWTTGLVNGAMIGVLIALGVLAIAAWQPDLANWKLGVVTGAAAMLAMSVGTFFGSGIPMLMDRVGVDPAQSSAIFLIMVTDSVAFFAILGLAFVFIEKSRVAGLL